MKARLILGLSLGMAVLTMACSELQDNIVAPLPAKVTYVEHIQPLLERSCVRCHNENVNHYGVILTSYENDTALVQIEKGNPDCRLLMVVLNPETPLKSETGWMYRFLSDPRDYDLIYQWIVVDSLAEAP